jgi:DNA helicase-2/ATP-dependent DNA helicase PcrA
VKERLGNSDLVQVSTIHETLWQLIKNHQKELVVIHSEKLKFDLVKLKRDLAENQDDKISKPFKVYRDLTDELKQTFTSFMLANKELYYNNYNKPAAAFKGALDEVSKQYPTILKSAGNFKKIVNTIFKINNYEQCLLKIEEVVTGYTSIKYDSKYNSDILHRMLISHDTLLEYSLEMVSRFDLLKRIIIDSYPYILIDEYQDTSEKVVGIMQQISVYSEKIKNKSFIGYFGDAVQNIYDDGVGDTIHEVHPNLLSINKKFNRRSHSEIIDVINKIRNDEIQQCSIYSDSIGGSVKFYCGQQGEEKLPLINAFTNKYKQEWNASIDDKLHCLVLTNKLVAELSGFPDIYSCFSDTSFYKRFYDRLNSELLSNEISKLGDVPNTMYKILRFKALLDCSTTNLNRIIGKAESSQLSFKDLKQVIKQLSCFSGDTLKDVIKSIFDEYEKSNRNSYFRKIICNLIPIEKYTYDSFVDYLSEKLFDVQDDNAENDKVLLETLLSIDIGQYNLWFRFIENTQNTDITYHTYHGTKGLEFENVVIIMENDFGKMNRHKFSSFFEKTIDRSDLVVESDIKKFSNTKNLLYVSCSRAIKNLRVLYLDDISSFENGINSIFTHTENFSIS